MSGEIAFDGVLTRIADYVADAVITSRAAHQMARYCLIDSLACAFEALDYPECARLVGPPLGGMQVPNGARVPGTAHQLDPAQAAFCIGVLVRWLDFNDTWVAAQTCHPSDDVGPILAVADYLSRNRAATGRPPVTLKTVLEYMIKAHEIQGVLGMDNPLSSHGIDHVLLLKIAATAAVAGLLGCSRDEIANAVSLALFEPSLALHRYGSNTGPRKGWAAAEAASQAVRYAHMALRGEPGYPQVLTHPDWGFNKVFLGGKEFRNERAFGSLVMTDVLFKLQCPVVIHAQSAIECAIRMHQLVGSRINEIARIELRSHRRTLKIIDKQGPLRNAADRDHCLQYAVAVALLNGRLTAADYDDEAAADPRIDRLRALMELREKPEYTAAYLDAVLRQNPNSIRVFFENGTATPEVEVLHPIGHPARRSEGLPALMEKFERCAARRFDRKQRAKLTKLLTDHDALAATPVHELTDAMIA